MSERIFIVVCENHHTDLKITVHRTRAGADAHVDQFVAEYDEGVPEGYATYHWTEKQVDGLERCVVTDSDGYGPSARIVAGEIGA